ncbi:MAG: ATP-binding protein [Gammaproteobacteria bacterium]|nr:ATP-binding protein [Gammaproteobacteria bacterium]
MHLRSLTLRLITTTAILLVIFLGLTFYALDKAYRTTVMKAIEERLQNNVFTLIAVAEFDSEGGIYIPQVMPVARYFQTDDGLYARIVHENGTVAWQSVSFRSLSLPPQTQVPETMSRFKQVEDNRGRGLFVYDFGVSWDQDRYQEHYTISIIESLDDYKRNIKRFRGELTFFLLAIAVILLIALTVLLRWSLAPLRLAASEIKQIEMGDKTTLEGEYPEELLGLTDNINALIQSNRVRLERYRNSSADLAHSIKTPLALLQGAAEAKEDDGKLSEVVIEQVDRLNQIVSYQLQRAATTGQAPLIRPEHVTEYVRKLVKSLDKVYVDKNIRVELDLGDDVIFYGDKSDFMEITGNLLDNAYKWAHSHVKVSLYGETDAGVELLSFIVEDDGPGIDPMLAARIMDRGVRSDGQGGGTGIGLAIVSDIVSAYDGQMEAQSSELGGAKFILRFSRKLSG